MKVVFIFIFVCSFLLDQGVSDAGSDPVQKLVKEGDPVTLHTGVEINKENRATWYFYNVRIAYSNGDMKICTDVKCPEGFRGRLKLDSQTGSLTIMNTRTTDSGEYKLLISSSNSEKIFSVTVIDSNADKNEREPQKEQQDKNIDGTVPGSGLSSGAVAGIVVAVVVLLLAVGVMIFRCRRSRDDMKKIKQVPELESNDETQNEISLMT